MVAVFLSIFSFTSVFAFYGIKVMDSSKRYGRGQIKKSKVVKNKKKTKRSPNYKGRLQISQAENKALKERLQNLKLSRSKLDFTTSFTIPTGTTLKGVLVNSVVSSNLTSPILVSIAPNKHMKEGAKLSCLGDRAGRRIFVACNRLIIGDAEYPELTTSLLNLDGSNGLKGDYWSGEERFVTGVIATSLASGVILSAQDSTQNQFGNQVAINTGKNTIIGGLASSADMATALMGEKLKKSNGVVTLKAGAKVLVYFNGGYRR